jgi:hypothetical protein
MTKDEALDLALEALEMADELEEGYGVDFKKYGLKVDKDIHAKYATAITAIKQARSAPTSADYAMGYAEGFNDGCKPAPVQEPVDSIQVSKVWWDNEKLMTKPIPFVEFYKAAQPAPVPLTDEQARDMPDCWVVVKNGQILATHDEPCHHDGIQAVRYAPAAQRQWVGLTDDDVRKINQEVWGYVSADHTRMRGYAHAIEAKLKEKNT